MKYRFFLILFLSIAFLFSTPKMLLFYDAPEYVKIVLENSFFNAISLGHFPIHPFFIATLWIFFRVLTLFNIYGEYAGNLFALFCGIINIILFSKLASKYYQSYSLQMVSTFIYALFPAVWIINTNLMIESFLLPLFLFSILLFISYIQKPNQKILILYIVSIILLICSHVVTIFWLPLHLGMGYLLKKSKQPFMFKWFFTVAIAVFISMLIYLFIYFGQNNTTVFQLKDVFFIIIGNYKDVSLLGLGRLIRNMFVTSTYGFGYLTIVLLFYLFFKTFGKTENIIILTMILLILLFGSFWFGDYMPRRIIFVAPLLAIIITRYFKYLSIFVLLYLIPITISNALLYSPSNIYYYQKLNYLYNLIPNNGILLQTHYLAPFTHFRGKTIYLGSKNWEDDLKDTIHNGNRVFIDSSALIAPYLLVIGENYHPTAFGTPKNLFIENIYTKYYFKPYAQSVGSDQITLYEIGNSLNKSFNQINITNKINDRRRSNYGDIFFRLWSMIENSKLN